MYIIKQPTCDICSSNLIICFLKYSIKLYFNIFPEDSKYFANINSLTLGVIS